MQYSDGPAWKDKGKRTFRRFFPLFLALWILLVSYPNPVNLVISIHRFLNPAVDPGAVEFMLDTFPDNAADIEKVVLARIPYGLDWELYGMPWYFPTVEEVLERGRGDCKARALVVVSVLQAKGIPSQVTSSPMHVWADYEGKPGSAIENAQVTFYQHDPETGTRWFRVPEIDLSQIMGSWRQQLWTPMPTSRRVLLIAGLLALTAARVLLFRADRRKKASPSQG